MLTIDENIKNFVREMFFFDGMQNVGFRKNDEEEWHYKDVMDYKLSDEWMGDENIEWLKDHDIIYRDDDDYYHIEDEYLGLFFTEQEMAEEKALWIAKHGNIVKTW